MTGMTAVIIPVFTAIPSMIINHVFGGKAPVRCVLSTCPVHCEVGRTMTAYVSHRVEPLPQLPIHVIDILEGACQIEVGADISIPAPALYRSIWGDFKRKNWGVSSLLEQRLSQADAGRCPEPQ
jgi:hypothetical protein